VAVLVFPELAITGYTCADLFRQATLLQGARAALKVLVRSSAEELAGIAIVGLLLADVGSLSLICVAFAIRTHALESLSPEGVRRPGVALGHDQFWPMTSQQRQDSSAFYRR
jgi:predicted amidohydrolase